MCVCVCVCVCVRVCVCVHHVLTRVYSCTYVPVWTHILHSLLFSLFPSASNFTLPVRLVNGSNAAEGRVEVRASSVWGTICASGFDTREASVVCRQLGYYGAVEVFSNSEFGPGLFIKRHSVCMYVRMNSTLRCNVSLY